MKYLDNHPWVWGLSLTLLYAGAAVVISWGLTVLFWGATSYPM